MPVTQARDRGSGSEPQAHSVMTEAGHRAAARATVSTAAAGSNLNRVIRARARSQQRRQPGSRRGEPAGGPSPRRPSGGGLSPAARGPAAPAGLRLSVSRLTGSECMTAGCRSPWAGGGARGRASSWSATVTGSATGTKPAEAECQVRVRRLVATPSRHWPARLSRAGPAGGCHGRGRLKLAPTEPESCDRGRGSHGSSQLEVNCRSTTSTST